MDRGRILIVTRIPPGAGVWSFLVPKSCRLRKSRRNPPTSFWNYPDKHKHRNTSEPIRSHNLLGGSKNNQNWSLGIFKLFVFYCFLLLMRNRFKLPSVLEFHHKPPRSAGANAKFLSRRASRSMPKFSLTERRGHSHGPNCILRDFSAFGLS